MIEILALGLILAAGGWLWRAAIGPCLTFIAVRRQMTKGIITIRSCTVEGEEELVDGFRRKLSDTELSSYRSHLANGKRFLAIFKYGTDTGLRIRETPVIQSGPGSASPFLYEAFDLRSPGKCFDTSYPYNESVNSREFAQLILRTPDRWRLQR